MEITQPKQTQRRCIRVEEVAMKLSIGKSTVWLKEREDPAFPKKFTLFDSGRAVVWYEHEVDEYIDSRAKRH